MRHAVYGVIVTLVIDTLLTQLWVQPCSIFTYLQQVSYPPGPIYENNRERIFPGLEDATLSPSLRRIYSSQRSRWNGFDIEDHADKQWIHYPDNQRLGDP